MAILTGDSLKGRTGVIVGASSGVGLAVARLFIQAGARVHAVARRLPPGPLQTDAARTRSGAFVPHSANVASSADVQTLFAEITVSDQIDFVVYTAGTNAPDRALERLQPNTWDEIVATNLNGAFYVISAALPSLRQTHGHVVLVNSMAALVPEIGPGIAYRASKSGLSTLAEAAALEERRYRVRFSTIYPDDIDTPLLDKRPNPPPDVERRHFLRPEDVAEACLFLISLPPRLNVPSMTLVPTGFQKDVTDL